MTLFYLSLFILVFWEKNHLEADLNKDIVKNFQVHEKEKLSKKWTRFEILITGVKDSRVMWPKSQEVCNNIKLTK